MSEFMDTGPPEELTVVAFAPEAGRILIGVLNSLP